MTDWDSWHAKYDDSESSLRRRLGVVRDFLGQALEEQAPGPIRLIAMCAGEGRDVLPVLAAHGRGPEVVGRLVELDPVLAARARAAAPAGIEVVDGDAGVTDAYAGAVAADVLMCCGVFGNISDDDIRRTIAAWSSLCAPRAFVLWTRGAFSSGDLRPLVRHWVQESGFDEVAYAGEPESYGVGLARLARDPDPFVPGQRLFTFR